MKKQALKNTAAEALNRFIDENAESTESAATAAETAERPTGFTIKKEKKETKSRRLQLMIRPSVYEAVCKAAKAAGTTPNDYINEALEYVLKGN